MREEVTACMLLPELLSHTLTDEFNAQALR